MNGTFTNPPCVAPELAEATLAAVFYPMLAWVVMRVAVALACANHPDYFDPNGTGGFMLRSAG